MTTSFHPCLRIYVWRTSICHVVFNVRLHSMTLPFKYCLIYQKALTLAWPLLPHPWKRTPVSNIIGTILSSGTLRVVRLLRGVLTVKQRIPPKCQRKGQNNVSSREYAITTAGTQSQYIASRWRGSFSFCSRSLKRKWTRENSGIDPNSLSARDYSTQHNTKQSINPKAQLLLLLWLPPCLNPSSRPISTLSVFYEAVVLMNPCTVQRWPWPLSKQRVDSLQRHH